MDSMNLSEHKRPSGVTFFPIGIYMADRDAFEVGPEARMSDMSDGYFASNHRNDNPNSVWKMRTLRSLAKMLHHENVNCQQDDSLVKNNMHFVNNFITENHRYSEN